MQSNNVEGNLLEIIDLAHTLRQEQLFIHHEQAAFESLSETFSQNSLTIAKLAWICSQQKQNLKNLIMARSNISLSCSRANQLENTKFIDAYKAKGLKYQHVISYIELFNYLYRSPFLLAQSLSAGDRISTISSEQIDIVINIITTGLYANAIHSKDVEVMLKLLRELIENQIILNENPRKMLRPGSSAFGRLYNCLLEYLFSAKIFLTAALNEPIMRVLIESETMLDIDSNKAILNLSRRERLKRFGEESSEGYQESIQKYHNETVENLFKLANYFLQSLICNWSLFPSTLRWLVQTMCHQLKQARINTKNINEILTDMVFTHFICPAIVSPDNLGISDAPISEQARFNLIQVGKIIQMLAMKYEDIDPKYADIYQKFDQNIVANLLEQLLVSDSGGYSNGVVAIRSQQSDFERCHVLITLSELNCFIDFLRNVLELDELNISGEDRKKLGKILDNLPDKFETYVNGTRDNSPTIPVESNNRAKQHLINLGKSTKNRLAKSMSLNVPEVNNTTEDSATSQNGNGRCVEDLEQVLFFPISITDENKLQLLTEEEVLKMNSIGQQEAELIEENLEKLDKVPASSFMGPAVLRPPVKTTRFSLSHDDASIGNSDNLEAVSEAPSNHSVTSSLELEENDQNDNLSDMISANVSGRGTPNISGRDTPSSQVTDDQQIPTPQMAKIINKTRSDIEDKFCKFEIKKLIEGDETVSIISDTWSTDVLASDSETLDANDRDRNFSTPLIPSAVVLPGDNNFDVLSRPQVAGYLEETRSESAWSTDVLVSDSEKLTEIDTDDNLSITAKSDTGRSESGIEVADGQAPNVHRTPDSPFFTQRVSFQTPDSPVYSLRGSAESPYFPNTNQYEDPNRFSSPISSLARSSTRTTNQQFSGENNFQQNYKTGGCSVSERAYLPISGSKIRRQNSAESSISNQSLNLEENHDMQFNKKDKKNRDRRNSKDLIDFDDYQQDGAVANDHKLPDSDDTDLRSEEDYRGLYDKFSEGHVIHRRTSSEQRNASFDGRRNGMMDFKSERRHQSLNYENHDIEIKKPLTPQRVVSAPLNASITDDAKTEQQQQQQKQQQQQQQEQDQQQFLMDEMIMIEKTETLGINDDGTVHVTTSTEPIINIDIIEPISSNNSNNALKPSKSTGAIPKSISFDASADKSSRSKRFQDPLRLNGTSFFHKIKQGLKSRKHNKSRHDDYASSAVALSRNVSFGLADSDINRHENNNATNFNELSEDILAKYRRKVSSSSETTNSDSTGNSCSVNRKNSDIEPRIPNGILVTDKAVSFLHAKKKIRSVLSTTDLHTGDFRHTTYSSSSPLLIYLKIQLAQALNLQNFKQISIISEAIRTLNSLDDSQNQKLIQELQTDIVKRQSYLQYLMRYRQNLLSTIKNIEQFEERLQCEREICNRQLMAVCIRIFLEKRSAQIEIFEKEFSKLTVVDEKNDLLQELIDQLMNELKQNDGILFGMTEWQLEEARISIERVLLQRLYKHVMFPNEDGDISRDEVLHEHIRKLQEIISPSHNALRIPQEFLSEAPWPFAQQQISYISAYKTPREKFQCVIRCISSITNLLYMACDREPAADDLLPVLIYVIIMANPPYLLSTIQYVNCFIGNEMDGQDQFFWTQFCSVVQFIKTIDYLD